ncbi:hypothetical protein LSAT2_029456 [Lamellibrachia satsuma]|nr:hypothetical protein LSAT2_029456 [Lamellibrachia satsuma]
MATLRSWMGVSEAELRTMEGIAGTRRRRLEPAMGKRKEPTHNKTSGTVAINEATAPSIQPGFQPKPEIEEVCLSINMKKKKSVLPTKLEEVPSPDRDQHTTDINRTPVRETAELLSVDT